MQHQWFFVKKGLVADETLGPFEEAAFARMVENGDFKKTMLISSPTRTQGQWTELSTSNHLLSLLERGEKARATAEEVGKQNREAQRRQAKAESDLNAEKRKKEEAARIELERQAHALQVESENKRTH